jgi:hypothetical protein
MLKLYKNKRQQFECKIEIDGGSHSKIKPRLIFYPSNDTRNLFFEGTIFGNTCTVNITPNVNINKTGKVVLEIIVDDSTLFQPWQSDYEIVTEQARVSEESINMTMDDITPRTAIVEDAKIDGNKVKVIEPIAASKKIESRAEEINNEIMEEQSKQESVVSYMKKRWSMPSKELVAEVAQKYAISANDSWKSYREVKSLMKDVKHEEKKNNNSLFSERCKITDKKSVNDYLSTVKQLPDLERKSLLKFLDESYAPKRESLRWSRNVFSDTDSLSSKICMYCREIK